MIKQQTIKESVSCSGIGLHTGVDSTITFKPSDENTGIRFIRNDVDGSPEIQADIDHVVDISRGTTIAQNGTRIHTVEHVLAALVGLEIDNILIELTNKEPPVMDGSSKDFVDVLQKANIVEQHQPREYLEIDKAVTYSDPAKKTDISVLPSDRYRLTCIIDYQYPWLGTQYLTIHSINDFPTEIAPARTFSFLSEVEDLREAGLVQGGRLDNAIVIMDKEVDIDEINRLRSLFHIEEDIEIGTNGILHGVKLRFENEPVRHKALDVIGDLALLGMPIKGHVIAARPGHAANVEIVKNIKKEYEKKILKKKYQAKVSSEFLFDINAISKILPHRYPFLLIDRILDMKPGESLSAIKNVSVSEPFFQGHFPNQPVMPGVLIIEAMAQAGSFMLLHTVPDPEKKLMYFTGIEKSKFRRQVLPGDQILFKIDLLKLRLGTCKLHGIAYVDDNVVAEATFITTIGDRKE
ncbi:MAG: UDP-3-O-[3-hydroxymyristoyl] N-acetylglucosamine deacetylase [Candidatus Marinimicrobia bacterium]|nr:UDP-3-O-[3-hydroxymyristoyl] N-acetylglucosamine deacetylase [Candidatus Neomarinimicrobiota bacterium]|tara:strand:- start:1791 stop:3185 length:1395 start_codon:yes stop_codon:yes gene_type:complete